MLGFLDAYLPRLQLCAVREKDCSETVCGHWLPDDYPGAMLPVVNAHLFLLHYLKMKIIESLNVYLQCISPFGKKIYTDRLPIQEMDYVFFASFELSTQFQH